MNRRQYLRSCSSLIALPLLESLGGASAFAQTAAISSPAKRMVFLGLGYGVTKESWFPGTDEIGSDYTLSEGLRPLEAHKKDMTILQNLSHRHSNEGHWGSTFWLTGANRYDVPGRSFHNTISADQVAAKVLGADTRYSSIQMNTVVGGNSDGHGPGSSLAWNAEGKPVAGHNTPLALYHSLFSSKNASIEEKRHMLKDKRSALDTVMCDARQLSKKLSKGDSEKLDEYFSSVREIETRLIKEDSWLDSPIVQPTYPLTKPQKDCTGVSAVETVYDLIIAAMQVDASRVFTYRMPVGSFIAQQGAEISAHSMSHYHDGERKTVSQQRDKKHAELLANFFQKLKDTKDVTGANLFENTTVAFGSNLNSVHNLHNCPTLVAGGGAGFQQGKHLVMKDKKTPLCNLWLSMLQGSGVEVEQFGNSTGVIEGLV